MKNRKFLILLILHLSFLIYHSSIANAIDVSGHLTENTIWSPVNNPYHVIDDVYVDNNVTLTILPGTVVKLNASPLTCEADMENFVYYNGANIAKMIQVDGKLIANGTAEEPVTFTRIQDSLYYHWGIIYLRENADLCSFKYCTFEYSAYLLIVLGIIPNAAVNVHNEEAIIEHCDFVDNFSGVYAKFQTDRIAITNNNFYNVENICPTYPGYHVEGDINIDPYPPDGLCTSLIAGNSFMESSFDLRHIDISRNTNCYLIDNYLLDGKGVRIYIDADNVSYFFDNEFIDCQYGIFGGEEDNSLYIKKNRFIGGDNGIDIDNAYVEISDNYFEGCEIYTGIMSSGKVCNNKIIEGNVRSFSYLDFFQNIGFQGDAGITITYRNESCFNNLSINNQYAFNGVFYGYYNNCIFISNDEITQYGVSGNPIFRNCILDFELPPECIDGGGNIWVDSTQAQELFEDIQNGDFHLIEGSLAIDAGFDTLGYYYPFDMDYSTRVWDGDGNGSSIIDIGPYEYNSPAFGGIEGYTYNPITGDPVDYVLLKINNQPGEFTFSDNLGSFEYKLPAGIYDVYAERVFYEDVIEYEIEVFDGQFTQVLIQMQETVDVENIQYSIYNFQLRNYPNPFNPTTTIYFTAKNAKDAKIEIFNVKGQKVRTFSNLQINKSPNQQIIWNGTDDNNKTVSSGIYFYKISVGKEAQMKKMLLLK